LKNRVKDVSANVVDYLDDRAPGLLPTLANYKYSVAVVLVGIGAIIAGGFVTLSIRSDVAERDAQLAPIRAFLQSNKSTMNFFERLTRRGRSKAVPEVVADIREASMTGFVDSIYTSILKTRQYSYNDATGIGAISFTGSEADYAAASKWIGDYKAVFQKREQVRAAKTPGYTPYQLPQITFDQVTLGTSLQGGTEVSFAIIVTAPRS
jgi:hypothetical protein